MPIKEDILLPKQILRRLHVKRILYCIDGRFRSLLSEDHYFRQLLTSIKSFGGLLLWEVSDTFPESEASYETQKFSGSSFLPVKVNHKCSLQGLVRKPPFT